MGAIQVLDPVLAMTLDLKEATKTLEPREVRYLVDSYYQFQEMRKRSDNQVRMMEKEPHRVLEWVSLNAEKVESGLRAALGAFAKSKEVGRWSLSIHGIGPVIAAGLLAHIDIAKAPTVGHIWRFAGLDPTVTWERGERRPWNASLKTLCWKIGESFVKVSNSDKDVYGKVYLARKEDEKRRNEAGEYADQATTKLERVRIGKDTEAYKYYSQGKLPPGHIHARAKRYATKLFLAHWHHVAWETTMGTQAPKPYIIEHGGHVDFVAPPNWPMAAS